MSADAAPSLSFAQDPPAVSVAVDLHCVIEQGLGLLIYGGSGSGKSHTLRALLEQTHGRIQHIVLDSEGEFHTLRGRFPYLLVAREGGDVPLSLHAAAPLAARIMETGVSAIVDLSGVRSDARPVFAAAFLDQLIETPPAHRRPCLVVVDEVHRFAPQQAASPSKAALGDVIAVGRKRGLIPVYATQSIERVDKNAISEIPNRLVGRIDLDVRMDRAADDLGLRGEDRGTLKAMRRGEFYAQGPILTRAVTLVRIPDTLTKKPPLGAAPAIQAAPPAPVDVLARFADLPEEDGADVGSLAEARKRIGELQAALKAPPSGEAPARTVEVEKTVERIVEVPALSDDQIGRLLDLHGAASETVAALTAAMDALSRPLADWAAYSGRNRRFAGEQTRPVGEALVPAPVPTPVLSPISDIPPPTMPSPAPPTRSVVRVSRPQQAILNALAGFEALGVRQPKRPHVALFADTSPNSSAFTNNLGALRTAGLIDYPAGGLVTLIEAGRRQAIPPTRALTRADLHRAWLSRLTGPQRRIVEALIAVYPRALSREDLAARTGTSCTSSAYTNNLGALRSLGLVDYPGKGVVAATVLLFPKGLD